MRHRHLSAKMLQTQWPSFGAPQAVIEGQCDSASTNGKQMAPTRIGQSCPHFSLTGEKKGLLWDPARMGPRLPADRPTKASSGHVIPLALACCRPSMPFLHRTLAIESRDRLGIVGLRRLSGFYDSEKLRNDRLLSSHWC